jgi:hypothetical protein
MIFSSPSETRRGMKSSGSLWEKWNKGGTPLAVAYDPERLMPTSYTATVTELLVLPWKLDDPRYCAVNV